MKFVPCLIADDLSDAEIKAFRLADNRTAELAVWDDELLRLELNEFNKLDLDFSMEGFGFDLDGETADTAKSEVEEDDFNTEEALSEIETPLSKRGDIWILGKHRLMCGDSTSSEDVVKLTDGQRCDFVITDPPYNVDYEGATKDKLKIQNDKMTDDTFLLF